MLRAPSKIDGVPLFPEGLEAQRRYFGNLSAEEDRFFLSRIHARKS